MVQWYTLAKTVSNVGTFRAPSYPVANRHRPRGGHRQTHLVYTRTGCGTLGLRKIDHIFIQFI